MRSLKATLRDREAGPAIRRFFINTLFDSTFMLLGMVVGAAFAAEANLRVIIVTMVTTSLALGISTGVSVYEAESLERERKLSELEHAMLHDLSNTTIDNAGRSIAVVAALINFFTPLLSCTATASPFALVAFQVLEINEASWLSVGFALGVLFAAGVYLGRLGRKNPWLKGLRMVGFGILAFIIGFLLDSLI